MFQMLSSTSLRGLTLVVSIGAVGWCGSSAHAAKERVTGPIYNGDVAGTNANQFYAELIGADLFYSWGAVDGGNNVLFNGGNNAGVNSFTVGFGGGRVLGNGAGMMFDSIRDKGGAITRKAGPGVIKVSTLQIAGMRDVVTRIDPLRKTVRKPANFADSLSTGGGLEIELTNESDDAIFVSSLSVRIDNIDDPLDFSTPFIPDGIVASLDVPFSSQSLLPGESLMYTYSGSYDENLPIAVIATSLWGGDSFTGTLGTYVSEGAVPEPGTLATLGICGLMAVRRRRKEK